MKSGHSAQSVNDARGGFVMSLAFWCCLVLAAGVFGVCSLAPRVVVWAELKQQSLSMQMEMIRLQSQVRHLGKVSAALETDPEFAARLARLELGRASSGEDATEVPLPEELGYDPRRPGEDAVAAPPTVGGWYLPWLRRVANDDALRRRGLAAAGGLTLFALLFLHEHTLVWLGSPGRLLRWMLSRYLIDEPDDGR